MLGEAQIEPWASWSIRTYSALFGDTWRVPTGYYGRKRKTKVGHSEFLKCLPLPPSSLPNRGGKTWCPGLGFRVALQLITLQIQEQVFVVGEGFRVY